MYIRTIDILNGLLDEANDFYKFYLGLIKNVTKKIIILRQNSPI